MSPNCSDSDKPKALTPADLSYLKALYEGSQPANAALERGDIEGRMRRDLAAH